MGKSIGRAVQVLAVQTAKQFMAYKIAGTLNHRDPELLFGLGEAFSLHQCVAQ